MLAVGVITIIRLFCCRGREKSYRHHNPTRNQRDAALSLAAPMSAIPMSSKSETSIPVSKDTRKKVKACKRSGEHYDDLLQKMVDQYDPDATGVNA
jgi:hypothetical protein